VVEERSEAGRVISMPDGVWLKDDEAHRRLKKSWA